MRTLRTIGIVGATAALLFSSTVAFAEERPMEARQIRQVAGESGKNTMGMNRPIIASTTASTTRMEMGKAAQERMQAVREEANLRMKAQREKAEQRLSDIKDKVKKEMAQRLAKQFENLNSTWTNQFMRTLDRHDAILKKIETRAATSTGAGNDNPATIAAIQSAKTAIATARTAVTAQAAKVYTLDPAAVTTTTATTTPNGQTELMKKLKNSFQELHKTLFKDLFALRDGPMTDARKAVQNALRTLGKISGDNEGNATSTTTGSNQ